MVAMTSQQNGPAGARQPHFTETVAIMVTVAISVTVVIVSMAVVATSYCHSDDTSGLTAGLALR